MIAAGPVNVLPVLVQRPSGQDAVAKVLLIASCRRRTWESARARVGKIRCESMSSGDAVLIYPLRDKNEDTYYTGREKERRLRVTTAYPEGTATSVVQICC